MGGILALILLGVFWYSQTKKVDQLESRIKSLESGVKQPVSATKGVVSPIPLYGDSYQTPQSYTPAQYDELERNSEGSSSLDKFASWIKEDFMVKVGALLLLIALGWFVSYAFANEWIDEVGRITLGLLLGVVFLGAGVWRMPNFRHQGGTFIVVGGTTILFTVYAAQKFYQMFDPLSALTLMFMTVVFMAFVSVRYRSENLAFVSLVMASVAILFTGSHTGNVVSLFTYLLIVSTGTLWVVWLTGWTRLTLAALVITYLYSIPYLSSYGRIDDSDAVMAFAFVFVTLFFTANMVSLVRRHAEGKKHMYVHTLTALGTAIFLFSWIETAAPTEWKSLLYVSWALVFAFGSYVVYSFTANYMAFYLYGATSLALIGIATASVLNGPALTIAYILEISLLILATAKIAPHSKVPAKLSFLMALPALMALESIYSSEWRDSIMHGDSAVLFMITAMLFVVGVFLSSHKVKENSEVEKVAITLSFITSGFFAVSLVWLITHAIMSYDLATTLSLIIYTIVGIAMFVSGRTKGNKPVSWAGSVLVGGVVVRLLFIDIWGMPMEGRIITFLIIGALLISTAFIGKLRPTSELNPNETNQ